MGEIPHPGVEVECRGTGRDPGKQMPGPFQEPVFAELRLVGALGLGHTIAVEDQA